MPWKEIRTPWYYIKSMREASFDFYKEALSHQRHAKLHLDLMRKQMEGIEIPGKAGKFEQIDSHLDTEERYIVIRRRSMNENNPVEELFRWHGTSLFRGEFDEKIKLENLPESPIIKAWLEDVDIIEITICSSNIGFVYTYTKPYSGWKR